MSRYWREIEGEGIGDARLVGGRWVDGPFEGTLIEDREAAVERMLRPLMSVPISPYFGNGIEAYKDYLRYRCDRLLRAALGEDT